ncbi:MAG: SDR family NAD(P)-dependent oxidoreductase [Alphaproteobacteria bacterium]|nr:SDR family NAD(P)-dependent oxidoreductase [Alphaproteobacteria bacterium]
MAESLQGARVLVTGSDGFIGSHLVESLVRAGAEVRAFVYYNSWNQKGWLSDVATELRDRFEIVLGDVRDTENVRNAASGCAYVFHLSSLIGIPYSYVAPRSYVETNIVGALNVLQACRDSDSLIRLVHVSTSEVYGTAQSVPIAESHPLVGQSPYSATKIGADMIAESFHLSFDLPVVTGRPFNTYGPRQTARAVIPTIASQLLTGCEELRLGALSPTRDFNFVGDTVSGLIALATCGAAEGQVVNLGSGQAWSSEETARLLMEVCDHQVPIVSEEDRFRPERSEVNRLLADVSRIKSLTGWASRTEFRDGLTATADWIGQNLAHFDPGSYRI